MSRKSARLIGLLLSFILLLFLFIICQTAPPGTETPEVDTQAELLDYYKDIYGEYCAIQLPRGEYCRVFYGYDEDDRLELTIWPLSLLSELELYTGDVFTCYPEEEINRAGEETGIIIEHHGSGSWHISSGFLLEILVDGQWYPLNPNWYYPGDYGYITQKTVRFPLNGELGYSLGRVYTYIYNEETEKYEYVFWTDRAEVQTRPGHYRFSTFVSDEDEQSYRVFCEFDLVE